MSCLLDSVRPLTTDPEHVDGSLVQLDEHPVVDLPEKMEDFFHLDRQKIILSLFEGQKIILS